MEEQGSEEEVWDLTEGPEDECTPDDLSREWSSRQTHFHTLGYRDGIEAGKKSSAQEGFDEGYLEGVKVGYRCGLTRGWTSAFAALPGPAQRLLFEDNLKRVELKRSHEAMSAISSNKALLLFHGEVLENEKESKSENAPSTWHPTGDISTNNEGGKFDDGKVTCNKPSSNKVEELHGEVQLLLSSAGLIS